MPATSQTAGGELRTPRERARAQTIADIIRLGRQHLAEHGAAALSLRAVARDLGVVSSAVYRYVGSRDELLTLLLVDAYNDLGDAVDAAVEAVPAEEVQGPVRCAGPRCPRVGPPGTGTLRPPVRQPGAGLSGSGGADHGTRHAGGQPPGADPGRRVPGRPTCRARAFRECRHPSPPTSRQSGVSWAWRSRMPCWPAAPSSGRHCLGPSVLKCSGSMAPAPFPRRMNCSSTT